MEPVPCREHPSVGDDVEEVSIGKNVVLKTTVRNIQIKELQPDITKPVHVISLRAGCGKTNVNALISLILLGIPVDMRFKAASWMLHLLFDFQS